MRVFFRCIRDDVDMEDMELECLPRIGDDVILKTWRYRVNEVVWFLAEERFKHVVIYVE